MVKKEFALLWANFFVIIGRLKVCADVVLWVENTKKSKFATKQEIYLSFYETGVAICQ